MLDSGFRARMSVEMGAEEMVDAIVSGAIPDPEATFARNPKWLKELAPIGATPQTEHMVDPLKPVTGEVRSR
jgi:hypothetical protein